VGGRGGHKFFMTLDRGGQIFFNTSNRGVANFLWPCPANLPAPPASINEHSPRVAEFPELLFLGLEFRNIKCFE